MTEIIQLVKELVSIPSPLGNTADIEKFVASRLEKIAGAEVELMRVGNLGNNVCARIIKDEKNPTILLNGHLDTVEICKGWTREPFKPVIEDDRLYGLGSVDMKAGVAVAMHAFEKLASKENINVQFVGTIDEEGNSAGAFELLKKGVKADLCLIPEPSNGTLMMGCRGRVVFEVSVRGASAHGSRPEEGINAISEASRLVGEINKIQLREHELLGKGSFCILEFTGGTRTLSVPDSCWLKVDRHYVPGETKESMMEQMKSMVKNLNSNAEFEISYWKERPTPFLEPFITPRTEMVNKFASGIDHIVSYGRSVGDYNAFAKIMPTVVYGPHGENWHGPDEWVSISSIKKCLAAYCNFIERM